MSDLPKKAEDKPNVFGIVLVGVAITLLLWASIVALQAYFLSTNDPVEDERRAEFLSKERTAVEGKQMAALKPAVTERVSRKDKEACYAYDIDQAKARVLADMQAGKASLVPAVGLHDQATIPAVPGYPDPNAAPATGGTPATPAKVLLTSDSIDLKERVQFETGNANIAATSNSLLDEVARILVEHPSIELLVIEGHTDNEGSSRRNKALSQQRAEAVRAYLIDVGLVAPERLKAVGWGDEKPIADNGTQQGREQNRRVELRIEKQAGSPSPTEPANPTNPAKPTAPPVSPATPPAPQ